MDFAHTSTSSGPNTEILLLGGGMVVLALVFFFQKTASRVASLVLAVLGVMAIAGAFTLAGGGDDGDVSIAIASPEDGATVDAGVVQLEVEVTGADDGHVHVFVDGDDAGMFPAGTIGIDLEAGERDIEVEHVDADHQPHDPPVTDAVTVTAE